MLYIQKEEGINLGNANSVSSAFLRFQDHVAFSLAMSMRKWGKCSLSFANDVELVGVF